jgi:MEDS: MEthanogen/methylotroph, DcmR Sensory domain
MSPWERLLECPHPTGHFVQLYKADPSALTRNVCRYLGEGLRRGEGLFVIVTPEHRELFSRHLESQGADVEALRAGRRLVFADAQETLARFLVAGNPDWRLFEKTVLAAMREVAPGEGAEGLRAYGEMVGVLWTAGQFAAAIRLEHLWNRLLEQIPFSLYCAYAIDVFGTEYETGRLESVLCAHTHLVPAQPDGTLEAALNRSIDEILGPQADELRMLIRNHHRPAWAVMPTAESMLLWLRKHLPDQADGIARRARQHYEALTQTAGH